MPCLLEMLHHHQNGVWKGFLIFCKTRSLDHKTFYLAVTVIAIVYLSFNWSAHLWGTLPNWKDCRGRELNRLKFML